MFCFHQKIVYVVAIIRFVLITSLSARKCIYIHAGISFMCMNCNRGFFHWINCFS